MHDIDRTTLERPDDYDGYEMEYEGDYDEFEFEADLDAAIDEDDEFELEYEYEYEGYDDPYDELEFEYEYDDDDEFEMEYEYGGAYEYGAPGPFDEQTEMELAAELLAVQDDEEMDQFLGAIAAKLAPVALGAAKKLLPKAAKFAGSAVKSLFGRKKRRRPRPRRRPSSRPRRRSSYRPPRTRTHPMYRPRPRRPRPSSFGRSIRRYGNQFMRSNTGQALKRGLRYTGRQVLTGAGQDIGGRFFGNRGRYYGGRFGNLAADAFGLELEGLSPEDQEFEVARRFVRLAGEATREAMEAPKMLPPKTVAKQAIKKASVKHAPGLAKKTGADQEFFM